MQDIYYQALQCIQCVHKSQDYCAFFQNFCGARISASFAMELNKKDVQNIFIRRRYIHFYWDKIAH